MVLEKLYEDILLYLHLAEKAEQDIAEFTGTEVGKTFRAILDKKVKRQDEDEKFWYFFHGKGFSVIYYENNFELAYDYSVKGGFELFYGNKAWFTIDDNPHIFQTVCKCDKTFNYHLIRLVSKGMLYIKEDNLYGVVQDC